MRWRDLKPPACSVQLRAPAHTRPWQLCLFLLLHSSADSCIHTPNNSPNLPPSIPQYAMPDLVAKNVPFYACEFASGGKPSCCVNCHSAPPYQCVWSGCGLHPIPPCCAVLCRGASNPAGACILPARRHPRLQVRGDSLRVGVHAQDHHRRPDSLLLRPGWVGRIGCGEAGSLHGQAD